MINRKRLLATFLALVRIDSLSRCERRVADFLKKELKKLGGTISEDKAAGKIGGDCGNVWFKLKGNARNAGSIMLNAHLDTVSPGTGIKPKVKKGYVVTDGTTVLGADNKAGVAVVIEVLRMLKERRVVHGDILALFTVAEEIGLVGAKNIKKSDLKADMGFTLDGGDVHEIINQAPSQDSIYCEVLGRAAHAGVRPEAGVNAIKVAGEAVSKMKLGRIDHETTANIGIIQGGIATNIVPDRVILRGEARSHSYLKLKAQVGHMRRVLTRVCQDNGARFKFAVTPAYRSFRLDRRGSLVKLSLKAARSVGLKPKIRTTGGGSDANIFNAMGIPTVIIGAGADKVHTTAERLSIVDMEKSVEMIFNVIKEVADEKE